MSARRPNRTPLYSSGAHERAGPAAADRSPAAAAGEASPAQPESPAARVAPAATPGRAGWQQRLRATPPWVWAVFGAMLVALPTWLAGPGGAPPLTQPQIDAAVRHSLDTQALPAVAARAYAAVAPSVVRVIGRDAPPEAAALAPPARPNNPADQGARPRTEDQPDDEDDDASVGTGVVIVDSGIILTNLHVVAGARHIEVIFHDGLNARASVINVMPESDLAVLRAHRIPDDLRSATMRSSSDLQPGDRVTAVGFPFGVGPSVSHGVVSGLGREFRSADGERLLGGLIQFDAMANPGSSGGPLVTDGGEVVGIVTAIYNPMRERFFVGVGFAVPIEAAAAGAGLPPF
jgi:S1-C subfamily serine protease